MMKSNGPKLLFLVVLLGAAIAVFISLQQRFSYIEKNIVPTDTYEIFALTDSAAGGFSTCEMSQEKEAISLKINVRSGMAYSYAGLGVNLLSVHHKPAAGFFDFTAFDSISVDVSSGRLRKVEVRILNDDPVYSRSGYYLSYRPQVKSIPANGLSKFSLSEFRTPEWWLSAQGLEEDDMETYFNRGALLNIINGEGTLRGIPDEILVKSIKLWGKDRSSLKKLYGGTIAFGVVWIALLAFIIYRSRKKSEKEMSLKKTGK